MTKVDAQKVLNEIKYHDDWEILLRTYNGTDRNYIQVQFWAVDVDTGEGTLMRGRKWDLSEHMTETEIVCTAFKAIFAAMDHEVREMFTYKGRKIFNPHTSVQSLIDLADKQEYDVRQKLVVAQTGDTD